MKWVHGLCGQRDVGRATIVKGQPLLTGEFQIILDRQPPIDYPPRVLVEVARDVHTNKYDEIIVETKATIDEEVMSLARKIASYPNPVAARTKAGFLYALEQEYSSAMRFEEIAELDCFRSGETQKAFMDFLSRKKG